MKSGVNSPRNILKRCDTCLSNSRWGNIIRWNSRNIDTHLWQHLSKPSFRLHPYRRVVVEHFLSFTSSVKRMRCILIIFYLLPALSLSLNAYHRLQKPTALFNCVVKTIVKNVKYVYDVIILYQKRQVLTKCTVYHCLLCNWTINKWLIDWLIIPFELSHWAHTCI